MAFIAAAIEDKHIYRLINDTVYICIQLILVK